MIALHDCPPEDRRRALECAVRVLETSWPRAEKYASLQLDGQQVPLTYARMQCGAVKVTHKDTGAIVAQSVPALLTVLDPALFHDAYALADSDAFNMVAECYERADLLQALANALESPALRMLSAPEVAERLRTWADDINGD